LVRLSTFLKIVASVLVGIGLLFGFLLFGAYLSLRDAPFDAPAVAPLEANAPFAAYKVLSTGSGYVVAGVAGEPDPHRRGPCSGRFALVFLDDHGRTTGATILAGPEQSRYCGDRVSAFLSAPDGGYMLAGWAVRDGGPDKFFGGRSTDLLRTTFRLGERGAPSGAFGDEGRVEGHLAAGRVEGAWFTEGLARLSESGEVHDDLVGTLPHVELWSSFEVEDDLLVAVDHGLDLEFQTFERDDSGQAMYRALNSSPPGNAPTVDLGIDVSVQESLLLGGILYVAVRDTVGMRINAVDPRRLRVVFGFNGTGAVRLRGGHVTSTLLKADASGQVVAVTTVIDRGHVGDRLHVLRFAADGTQDSTFGGRVKRNGRDVRLDPGLDDAVIDPEGRTLALGGGSTSTERRESVLVRLDVSGKLDPSFGEDGIVRLGNVRVCELTSCGPG
jgi:hypothetical protein